MRKNNPNQCDFIGEFLAGDAPKVGRYGFPALMPENHIPGSNSLPANYLTSTPDLSQYWIHYFVSDTYSFRLWRNFEYYLPLLKKCAGVIGSDFSLFRNYSTEQLILNCYRNRVLAYALQQAGCRIIPTASFAGEDTWSWCFDGLPIHSTVAVTTNGILSDREACRLFIGGIDALVATVDPRAIVICGKYPAWLNTKYPNVHIVPIPSYSQLRHNRKGSVA